MSFRRGRLRAELGPVGEIEPLAARWRRLEERADASFFLSWDWIGTWLLALRREGAASPLLLELHDEAELVALAMLTPGKRRRSGIRLARTLALNETGDARFDAITTEHNGLLADRRRAPALAAFAIEALAAMASGWDELLLGGVDRGWLGLDATPLHLELRARRPCYIAELEGGDDPVRLLGRNARYQVGRALRDFAALGPLTLRCAEDLAEAGDFLAALKDLHQAYWRRRGKPGAFASPFFERFHRLLVERSLPNGGIQLLRVAAGERAVGFLYNFVYRRRVYNYQSGFDYDLLPRGKPGLLSHAQALRYNRERGMASYDFLAGDNQLKRSLSTRADEMFWLALQRETPLLRAERRLRRWREQRRARVP